MTGIIEQSQKELSIDSKKKSIEWKPFRKHQTREKQIRKILRNTPLFEGLSKHDWKLIAELFHERTYEQGEIVFELGMPGLGMYFVIEGAVRVVTLDNGEELYLNTLREGDFFGEMSLIEEADRTATIMAEVPTVLVGLFRPQLEELMKHRPNLGNTIYKRISQIVVKRLRQTIDLLSRELLESKLDHEIAERIEK